MHVRYKDTKDVHLLTSKHHAGFFEKSRYMVGGKLQTFKKPAHIEFYNQNMGSVDAVDQDLEPYIIITRHVFCSWTSPDL
jgi:hypothetical protein